MFWKVHGVSILKKNEWQIIGDVSFRFQLPNEKKFRTDTIRGRHGSIGKIC